LGWQCDKVDWSAKNADFSTLIGCHGNISLGIGKRGPDRSSALKTLSFGVKIAKIGLVDKKRKTIK